MEWQGTKQFDKAHSYSCACGAYVASIDGLDAHGRDSKGNVIVDARIRICPKCHKPTFFSDRQIPAPAYGEDVPHLPSDIDSLYDEARQCMTISAFTAAAMLCRKMLMNISVSKGAKPGESYVSYVRYLFEKNYITEAAKDWVDLVKDVGNVANHVIDPVSEQDARDIIDIVHIVLMQVYEFPARFAKVKT